MPVMPSLKMPFLNLSTPVPPAREPRQLVKWSMTLILLAGLYVWSALGTHLSLQELARGIPQIGDIVGRMLPPNFSILGRLVGPTLETLQISIWGTTLGVVLAIPFGLLAARNTTPHPVLYGVARLLLNAARSINEMIFGLIFVAAVGLGPFPGVLALAFHSVGMLGKFFAETIENIDPGPVEAVTATGAARWQVIRFAVVPQIMPEFVSICLYRWELNFRQATVLGIVGAGGIGFELITSMRLFQYQDLLTILIMILAMVTLVDTVSSRIRARII